MTREALVDQWFSLTREQMPSLAAQRGWPVRFDHCFQRILLDNAVGTKWAEVITPPAYRNISEDLLRKAIALGERVVAGKEELGPLNTNSLAWRGKLKAR